MISNMSSREKLLVGLAIPATLLVVFYYYVWQPTEERIEQLRLEVPQKKAELAWMEHEIALAAPWLGNVEIAGGENEQPILTVIEQRAAQAGIKSDIQRVQPLQDARVRIWFKEVVADSMLRFVDSITVDGLSVHEAALTRAADGRINARITLQR